MRKGIVLTDAAVERLPIPSCRKEIADVSTPNLMLVCHPSGRRTWSWRGRMDGRPYRATLGHFPACRVAEARRLANEIGEHRAQGVNIAALRKHAAVRERQRSKLTCDIAFEMYMEEEGNSRRSASEKWRIYRREVSPVIGHILLHKVRYEDLMPILRRKFATAPIQSNRIRDVMRRWFRWSATHGRDLTGLEQDPAINLPKLGKPKSATRVLSDDELILLLRALDDSSSLYVEPYRFILYTGCRRMEAFGLRWDELSELDSLGVWRLPSERAKNGVELVLPLPKVLVNMLKARRLVRGDSELVWPTNGTSGLAMSGFSKALRGFERAMNDYASVDGMTVPHWTAHDLRRTFITRMHGLKDVYQRRLQRDVIFAITNHKEEGIRATYNHYKYYDEKQEYLEIWAAFLAKLRAHDHRQLSLFRW
jgi:integrase